MPDIKTIADNANIVVNGYAFTREEDGIRMHVHASDSKLSEGGSAKFFVKSNGDAILQNRAMNKAQLISMIHFLEERDEENKKENLELKELIKELQETHNQKVKSQADLLASFDRLTKQVANLTEDNKKLQQRIDELLKQI